MKLDDKVFGHIAKVLQVAIITGTDIVDNLRTLELTVDDETGNVTIDSAYLKSFENNVNAMIAEVTNSGPN